MPEPIPQPDPQLLQRHLERIKLLETDNKQLMEKLESSKAFSAELQMDMLRKHAELDNCLQVNERLVSELVRDKAKMLDRGNKIEAVKLVAEATAMISSVQQDSLTIRQAALLYRAEQYLAESNIEIEKENFEGASYLCRKAIERVQAIEFMKNRDEEKGESAEISFSTPLQVTFLKTSNVRNAPSLNAKILAVIGAGHSATNLGYKGVWVKVQLQREGEGVEGWVHYSLLR